ncbi:MAG TPA: hypothetical protein ENK52_06635, partial [Saprospiraceae bacterium]|nr:hypothetical protein [Saprospiraceae bacterium]
MTIYFGLELDDLVHPKQNNTTGGIHYFGPTALLFLLESQLGLIGHPNDNEFLRIEQYRQLLHKILEIDDRVFFKNSFEADQFATATALLERRDELLLADWDFDLQSDTPQRLAVLAKAEQVLKSDENDYCLSHGFADRFMDVLAFIKKRKHSIQQIFLNEPMALLPYHFQKLFKLLETTGVKINFLQVKNFKANSDLNRFKSFLTNQNKPAKLTVSKDGTLLLLKTKRETSAASYLAKLFQKNPDFRPVCLIPEKNRALDNALVQEGLPSLGILSASLARPSLQILKLISTFLWNPIDPYKILEFVSLSVKPLADDLAKHIARQMAKTPGLKSEAWYIMIHRYFDELQERAKGDPNINFQEIKNQFEFWFNRKRYNITSRVPKEEVISIFQYLAKWAFKCFEEDKSKNTSLLVLSQQAQRVTQLLEALPESDKLLSNLELERIVRTIYKPSPVVFQKKQLGHLDYFHKLSGIIAPVPKLLWWNFIHNEQDHFFSKWYQHELDYLQILDIRLTGPKEKNKLLLWQRTRPILHTQEQLILVIPQMVEGSKVQANPLLGDLEACFENLDKLQFDIDSETEKELFEQIFVLPKKIRLAHKQLGKPKAKIQIQHSDKLKQNEEETFTSLDALFYYPYQWVFRHKIKLKKSSILSVVNDNTLMGNLAHRFFELMFRQDISKWKKSNVEEWIDRQSYRMLAREGAVLLLYGREPEKVAFINKIKYAAWSLVSMIQSNGWKVLQTEMPLAGKFQGIPVKGKADLVLQRGDELAVVDLKWRGAARREKIIKNEEDLQ